ncbi:hypothetical protein KI427_26520 (plasmid) [Rhodococcus ruber]|uniref:hypothetical protein n=1 Tax=Rhodococcus ruber TaxID=1830 RepID=UPI00200FAE9C|nr:hypothetical protein [Rhodococcus ruber]UQB75784.1 hypothetical protein KI427_26520 [Rhodococcus ruber]
MMSLDTEQTRGTSKANWVVRRPEAKRRPTNEQARRDLVIRVFLGLLIPVGALVIWELSARAGWIDPRFFSQPSAVAAKAAEDISSGLLWEELRITLVRLLTGYVVGSVSGVVVGLALSLDAPIRLM